MLQIAIFGRPGCGKGTQSKLLGEELGLTHVSSGDLLRREKDKAGDRMRSGRLFDDSYVIRLMQQNVPDTDYILDGFPRSIPQLEIFPIGIAIYLNISEREGERRALERGRKSHRADDSREAYVVRTKEFAAKTMPVIERCREKGILLEVDGEGSIGDVFERIKLGIQEMQRDSGKGVY